MITISDKEEQDLIETINKLTDKINKLACAIMNQNRIKNEIRQQENPTKFNEVLKPKKKKE